MSRARQQAVFPCQQPLPDGRGSFRTDEQDQVVTALGAQDGANLLLKCGNDRGGVVVYLGVR